MPDNGSAQPAASQPYGKFLFHYEVTWSDGTRISFQEVTGLDADTQATDYRSGNRPTDSTTKQPGIRKSRAIVLKRGVFSRGRPLPDWLTPGKANLIKRGAVTIELVDAKGTPRKRWKLRNALPLDFYIPLPDMDANANAIAIQSIVIECEGWIADD